MYDIVLKNGQIIDGTGRPGFAGDIGICGDKIAGVGELDSSGARIFDIDGYAVSPGFIDIHSHTDELILTNPTCQSKVTQGVTTEVSGNCGDSAAPLGGKQDIESMEKHLAENGIDLTWRSMGEFLDRLEQAPMSANFITLVGHGIIRSNVIGYDDRQPTDDELAKMRDLVKEAMEAGALGISSGLIYPPGCYSSIEELIALCKTIAPYGGIYATHMRNEGHCMVEALTEAIRIGRESGAGVQISHHKACGMKSWGTVKDTLAMIADARAQGVNIWADQYPYIATSTGLGAMLPHWAYDGGRNSFLERLKDPTQRSKLLAEVQKDTTDGWIRDFCGWESVVISSVRSEKNKFCEGLNITEIAKILKKDDIETALDLLLEERGGVGMVHFVINEKDVATIMRHPMVLIGSDATARATTGPLSIGKPHPRAYGTFARVLGKYVREDGILTLEEAISKMTGRTAKRLGLSDRGVIAEGNFADITVFDPNEIKDMATFTDPHQTAVGVKYVIVNGRVVLDEGELLQVEGPGPGRALRRKVN